MSCCSSKSLLFLLLSFISCSQSHNEKPSTFIVHASKSRKPTIFATHNQWYWSTLSSLPQSSLNPTKILYTYDHAIHGFAASLTPSQAAALERTPGIISVLPDRTRRPATTRSPSFLGLSDKSGIWLNSDYASDIVIGVIDSGVWPERPSFSDKGLGHVPEKWKGRCENCGNFTCNRKLIGAMAFYNGYEEDIGGPMNETLESRSPRDIEGHGTHTASTAAGAAVPGAGFYKLASGETRGVATKARIAVYKVCWLGGCFDSDILAAIDQAVADGVHIISFSVTFNPPNPNYDSDSISIGSFGASQNGVLFVAAAGNYGPAPSTVVNTAPWILTVGASTIDREFLASVVLGDGSVFKGVSLYAGKAPSSASHPSLCYGKESKAQACEGGHLQSGDVAGKIVVCDNIDGKNNIERGKTVKEAGGLGMILVNTEETGELLSAELHILPATVVGRAAGDHIRNYVRSKRNPTGWINFQGAVIGPSPPSPKVAPFSSRGPTDLTPEILKPDVIAPGVNVLASWTGANGPTGLELDPRRVEFNFQSGTSMACPHVSGLAALLRKIHPNWSPAAIKSAIMTTAYNIDNSGEEIKDLASGAKSTPFFHGAGHVNPNKALDPGLVYDLHNEDYVAFLCAIGYDQAQILLFTKDQGSVDCSKIFITGPGDLNYPSFSVVFKSDKDEVSYHRTVKNVGSSAEATYKAQVIGPGSVNIKVSPSKLVFGPHNQTQSYVVKFSSVAGSGGSSSFGAIIWSDGSHEIRSPIAFSWASTLS